MRQNQQFKRSRGRNNNRKHSNPLSRSFESNGPDVKIRGNAAQIAEKYMQLARDAQASGDSVGEQNYLQHAEHYFRLVMAAQPQGQPKIAQPADDENADNRPGDAQPVQQARANTKSEGDSSDRAVVAKPENEAAGEESAPPASENSDDADAKSADDGDGKSAAKVSDDAPDADEPPRRARRTRRKPRTPAADKKADPGEAPQPDLPAFITSNGQADAAE